MEEMQIQVEDYQDYFGSSVKFIKKLTDKQKKSALTKVGTELYKDHKGKTEVEINGNIAIIKKGVEEYKYQYYITRKTERSPYPWYQISKEHLDGLQEDCLEGIICLFFDESVNGNYPVYFKIWKVDDIRNSDDWKTSKSRNGVESFRWNPQKNYKDEKCMKPLSTMVGKS